MLLVAFGIKAAVFPLSFWLPDSYPTAPAPVTAVFAGLLTKVGVYAIIRTQTLLFPDGALDDAADGGRRWRRWSSASSARSPRPTSSGSCPSPWSATSATWCSASRWRRRPGWPGAIFYVVHHITVQTTLFLVAGLVERRGGITSLDRLGGLATAVAGAGGPVLRPGDEPGRHPAALRVPRQVGLLRPASHDGQRLAYVLVAGGVLTSLLTLVAIARVWNRAFWRPPAQSPAEDDPRRRGRRRRPGAPPAAAAARRATEPTATDSDGDGDPPDPRRPPGERGLGAAHRGRHRHHAGAPTALGGGRAAGAPAAAAAAAGDGRRDGGDGRGDRRPDRRSPARSTAWPTGRPRT